RVAGAFHGNLYFPDLAAVEFSFNPYGWHEDIDPRAGVLRLVFGLGTRAVERSDDDYTRLVALNAPHLRPDSFSDDLPVPAQQWVDVLDLEQGRVSSRAFRELTPDLDAYVLSQVATEDPLVARAAKRQGIRNPFLLRLSFEGLLKHGDFVASARTMLRLLEEAYEGPVDVELAVNFREDGNYRIHLLQCRPMQVKGMDHPELPPLLAPEDTVIFRCHGPVIGRSRFIEIAFLLYVVPEKYSALSEREQYAVARIIGELNRRLSGPEVSGGLMLVGPGRWGSAMPSLGLPVSFADINHAAVICEILAIREDLVTEVSLGTHFFNDLVELDMLYISLKQDDRDAVFYRSRLEQAPNLLAALMPEAARYEDCLRLIQGAENASGKLWLRADTQGQDVCLYREE
ncbi:MAG TPA: PEP/pyruvate-binding domain-containing protein, partial [Candidatus Hydrogenedentes bacterium]|nr:PEP/pyruvate-binding domain-containing protein [Candidatus Hydrogenedentota bacterium]